jgi:hypothetical protein
MNKEITGSTGVYSPTGVSGATGAMWSEVIEGITHYSEVIEGITHYFTESYANGKTINKTDRVEYNGNKILFSEYLSLKREEKINQILND